MRPQISIITITFNSGKTLERTIQSVISQNYEQLEYLIIDGGSTDNTMDIVKKYHDHISFSISEPDHGISDAFNKGIHYATGEIIGIINSDDTLLPGALDAIANAYDPKIDVYRGHTIYENIKTKFRFSSKPSLEFPVSDYMKIRVCHQGTFVTKAAYARVGGYKTYIRYIMDMDLLFRLYNSGCTFKYVPYDIAVFYSGGATSDSFNKKVGERYRVIRENGGSVFTAIKVNLHCIIKDIAKIVFDTLFGENFKYRLRGRKNLPLTE